jgi:hypothetical protein
VSRTHKFVIAIASVMGILVFCYLRAGRYCNTLSSANVSCWVRCHQPPAIFGLNTLINDLRSVVNHRLTWIDRTSGFLTTPMFKMSGIQGWRDYRRSISIDGEIKQVAHSLDGMTTLDIRLSRIVMDGESYEVTGNLFIRMELFECVTKNLGFSLVEGERIQSQGNLMWDGDGFFELHPSNADAIRYP